MKNIGIFVGCLGNGGAERIAGLLSIELSKIYDVYIFLLDSKTIVYEYEGTIIDLYSNGYGTLEENLKNCKKKYKIDCCISFLEPNNFMNIVTAGNEKVIISERCTQSLFNPPRVIEGMYIKELYNHADSIVAVSDGVKEDLVKNYGISSENVTTIYNFINKDNIRRKAEIPIGKQYEELIGKSKLIVNVGRLDPQKNQKMLIRQCSFLIKNGLDIKLAIVGAGPLLDELKLFARENEIESNVLFVTYNKNPFQWYKRADVVAVSSEFEGLPNAVLEAMTLGAPIVSVDSFSGPRELISDFDNYDVQIKGYLRCSRGILVERVDTELTGETTYMANAITQMLSDDEYRKDACKNSLLYMDRYNNNEILNQWIEVIENTRRRERIEIKSTVFKDYLEEHTDIIVYGAGKIGKRICELIKHSNISPLVNIRVVVSDKKDNPKDVCGYKVYEVNEIQDKEDALVLLALSTKYHAEVTEMLIAAGFTNIKSANEFWL